MKYAGITAAALALGGALWISSTGPGLTQEAVPSQVDREDWIVLSDSAGLQLLSSEMAQLWVRSNGEWRRIELMHPVRVRR